MKSWKDLPYWGRGAFMGVVVCIIFIFFQTTVIPEYFYNTCGNTFCMSPFAQVVESFYNATLFPVLFSIAAPVLLSSQAILNITALAYYFFGGAFFGLIYGKIRHGKDTIHPPRHHSQVSLQR